MHDVFGSGFFPQREVGRIVFLLLTVESSCCGEQFVDIAARQLAVVEITVVFGHIEIYRTMAFVCIAAVKYFLDIFYLFDYVARRVWFY